jgi:iron complex transport system substrate-binding protein
MFGTLMPVPLNAYWEITMNNPSKGLLYAIMAMILALTTLPGSAAAPVHGDAGHGYPVSLKDSGNHFVVLKQRPRRVVSLVPTATDIIYALGAQAALVGVTYHSTYPAEVNTKAVLGGFFRPSVQGITTLKPDAIFYSAIQKEVEEHFRKSGIVLIQVDNRTMEDGYRTIEMLGKVFHCKEKAAQIVAGIKAQVTKVGKKTARIPESKRKRALRLMGMDRIMTPGDDSFQNEFIRAAGGIPPTLGRNGPITAMTKEEWQEFNPQLIYYCGKEWELSKKYFDKPGWRDADAVRNKNYVRFPCELTCRASVYMGSFIEWLAANMYPEEFHDKNANVTKEETVGSKELELGLDYIAAARIVTSMIRDFPHQTLLIDLKEPMSAISSLEGPVSAIESVGNHHLPPPAWNLGHAVPLKEMKSLVCGIIGKEPAKTSLLFTGAKMDNLSIQKQQFKDMIVYALVTAGVEINAVRAGTDTGNYYEPGTINILILTNVELTPRAMTKSIIAATEGKTAALQDLDIRSSYTPSAQATGTGTDNIIVVQGRGPRLDNAGGHSKMGELVSRAACAGVKQAIAKQNGLVARRNIFKRMSERKIDAFGITTRCMALPPDKAQRMAASLENLLLQPRYAGFIESAFSVSSAYEKGLIHDLAPFKGYCKAIAEQIAATKVDSMNPYIKPEAAPKVIRMAFDALINGVRNRPSEGSIRN